MQIPRPSRRQCFQCRADPTPHVRPQSLLDLTLLGTASGDIQAYPSTAATPVASILNYTANENIANLALINTATVNAFTIRNASSGTVDFIIDTNGYFS
jgi:hypothetical protein